MGELADWTTGAKQKSLSKACRSQGRGGRSRHGALTPLRCDAGGSAGVELLGLHLLPCLDLWAVSARHPGVDHHARGSRDSRRHVFEKAKTGRASDRCFFQLSARLPLSKTTLSGCHGCNDCKLCSPSGVTVRWQSFRHSASAAVDKRLLMSRTGYCSRRMPYASCHV